MGQPELAGKHCDEALDIAKTLVGEDHPFYGRLLVVKGRAAINRRNIDEAHRTLLTAISLIRAGSYVFRRDLAVALYHLAQTHSARGEHSRAIEAATEARDIEQSIFGSTHSEVAEDELLLAQILTISGRLHEAEDAAIRCIGALGDLEGENCVRIRGDLHALERLIDQIRRNRGQ